MNSRTLKFTAPILAAIIVTTGCTTLDPYTREEKTSSATKGALIGAAAGAVVGLVSGDDAVERRQRALIGAGVGALAGGSIGYYMDRQEAELRAELEGTGVSVARIGDNVTLVMPGNVTFATNSSNISADFYNVLNSVALVLNEFEKTYIDVIGHTDSTGADSYNQQLSEARASSVARYLESQQVLAARIVSQGLGESSPIASNDTPDGRALNRRVEIILTPVT